MRLRRGETFTKVRTCIRNLQLRFSIFFCFSKRKRWQKKTSPGGFRFPSGAPLNRPEKPLRFFWTFPAKFETAQNFRHFSKKLRRVRCPHRPGRMHGFLQKSSAKPNLSTGPTEPSAPTARLRCTRTHVGADDSVRPQDISVLRKSTANPKLPTGPTESSAPTESRRIRTTLQISNARRFYRRY